MLSRNTLGRIGGLVALLSLFLLPLASCGTTRITGTDLLFDVNGNLGHKAVLVIALLAAAVAVLITTRSAQVGAGIAGLLAIGVEYFFTQDDSSGAIRLLDGSYVAMAGFLLVLVSGLMQKGRVGNKSSP
jgi:hypothetical protein